MGQDNMKTVAHLDQIVEIDPHFYYYLGRYVFDKHNILICLQTDFLGFQKVLNFLVILA